MADNSHQFGGPWTQLKLEAVRQYFQQYNVALKNTKFKRIYIDAFAGTGRCDIKASNSNESIDGSAKLALDTEPSFDGFYFIESDPNKCQALKLLAETYPDKRGAIHVVQGDANQALKENILKVINWKSTRAVLFLDPYGFGVNYDTLQEVSKTQAIDVWYLFPYSGLYREMPRDGEKLVDAAAASLDRILGTTDWREEFYKEAKQINLFSSNEPNYERTAHHSELLNFASDRLKELFTITTPKILYGATNAPPYALYFSVSNQNQRAQEIAFRIAEHILTTLK